MQASASASAAAGSSAEVPRSDFRRVVLSCSALSSVAVGHGGIEGVPAGVGEPASAVAGDQHRGGDIGEGVTVRGEYVVDIGFGHAHALGHAAGQDLADDGDEGGIAAEESVGDAAGVVGLGALHGAVSDHAAVGAECDGGGGHSGSLSPVPRRLLVEFNEDA